MEKCLKDKQQAKPTHSMVYISEHLQVIRCQSEVTSDCCAVVILGCQTDTNL